MAQEGLAPLPYRVKVALPVSSRGGVRDFDQLFCALRYMIEMRGAQPLRNDLRAVPRIRFTGRMTRCIAGSKRASAPASSLAVKLIHSPATVIVTIILLVSNAFPQSDSERLGMSANELARKVVTNELKFQDEDHGRWMYRLEKEESGKKQVQEILETNNGSLSRLLSIDGRPLDAKQQQKENQRMQRLVSHPDEQRKLQQASNKKAEQGARLFNILPDVFVFELCGSSG